MRTVAIFLFLTITCLTAHAQNPFLALKYDSVVMYDYEPVYKISFIEDTSAQSGIEIVNRGFLNKNIKKSVLLDVATTASLNTKIGDPASYGGQSTWCFDPHLGFVYYERGKIVEYISVCLSCNQLRISSGISFIGSTPSGLGKNIRAYFNELIIKHNFSHQIEPGNFADK